MSSEASGHRVVVYYQTQYDHSLPSTTPYGAYVSPLPLVQFITHLIIAAFHLNLNLPTKLALNDNAPDDDYYTKMWEEVGRMQGDGVKVLGMLGGSAPGSYDCLTPEHFEEYYPLLGDTIRKHHLDGIDLDVEQSVPIANIERLIDQLRADFGPEFIITLAPVASALLERGNLSGFDYVALEQAKGGEISWYNAQFYSGFGSIFPDDQYINITEYHGGIFTPERLVAGVLTNGDDGSGYVEPKEVVASIQKLVEKFGEAFGGVAGWEYFNSLPAPGKPWKWAELMMQTMKDAEGGSTAGGTTTSTTTTTTNSGSPTGTLLDPKKILHVRRSSLLQRT